MRAFIAITLTALGFACSHPDIYQGFDGAPIDAVTPDVEPATTCPALSPPADGTVSVDGETTGSAATYTCHAGFTLFGDATRTCGADGRWSGHEPTCSDCPCFDGSMLDAVEADVATTGSMRLCEVDHMGGGTTITLLMSAHATFRFTGSAFSADSLPGTHLACGYGCIDDTPDDGIDDCVGLLPYADQDNVAPGRYANCRRAIAMRCAR